MWKKIVTCDVGIAQCEDGIVKCEEKKQGNHQMWEKKLSHVMLKPHNVRIEPSNVRKK